MPPPPTPRVPESVGCQVSVFVLPITVSAIVRPLNPDVDVAIVMVLPDCTCPAGPRFCIPAPATPQAPAVAEMVPSVANCAQRVPAPPADETVRFDVDAVSETTRLVVVAVPEQKG